MSATVPPSGSGEPNASDAGRSAPVPVPDEVDVMPPGPMLAELLAELDVETVSGFDTVRLLQAAYRQLCHDRAVFLRILHETGLRAPGSAQAVERLAQPGEFAAEEARAALVWSRTRSESTYSFAVDVLVRLPELSRAMLTGHLDEPRVRAFVDWTRGLTDAQAASVCEQLLPDAPDLMVGELIDRIKRACLAIDPDWAEKRYHEGVKTRRVRGSRNPDGTANLGGYNQPLDRIAAASERIDSLARACKRAGDRRPIDLIRSDLFIGMTDGSFDGLTEAQVVDYVLANPYTEPSDSGGDGGAGEQRNGTDAGQSAGDDPDDTGGGGGTGPRGSDDPGPGSGPGMSSGAREPSKDVRTPDDVEGGDGVARSDNDNSMAGQALATRSSWAVSELRVELATVLGLNEHPGEIPPWGPVPAAMARGLVSGMHSGEWRYVFCDGDGRALAGGLLRARPDAEARERTRRDARRGGILEIAVPVGQFARTAAAQPQGSAWAPVLAELVRQVEQLRGNQQGPGGDVEDRRTPTVGLRRRLQQRDRQCVHPSCRMPAGKADQDHRVDYAAGGATTGENMEPKCRHDHRLKHEGGWTVISPEPGLRVWISGLGHRYESRPPPVVPPAPEPYPDPSADERWDPPAGWLEYTRRAASGPGDADCDGGTPEPILPPSPRRVPDPEPTPNTDDEVIFDPDEKAPF